VSIVMVVRQNGTILVPQEKCCEFCDCLVWEVIAGLIGLIFGVAIGYIVGR